MATSTSTPQKLLNYPQLGDPALEIRLLKLLPNLDISAPILVELRAVNLADVEGQYTALSYAWGDPNNTAPITLNGHIHHVTVNLQSALRHLRHSSEVVMLWGDAVCINQDDDAEKSSQVQQMGRIYRSADLVTVWLGEARDDSDFVIDLLIAMAMAERADFEGEKDKGKSHELSLPKESDEHPLPVEDEIDLIAKHVLVIYELVEGNGGLSSLPPSLPADKNRRLAQAMTKFLHRDWWSRLWVVQEVLLAREVLYHCGWKKFCPEDLYLIGPLTYVIWQSATAEDVLESYEQLAIMIELCEHRRLNRRLNGSVGDGASSHGDAVDESSDDGGTSGKSWSDDDGYGSNTHDADNSEYDVDGGDDDNEISADSDDAEGDSNSDGESVADNSLPSLLLTYSRQQTTKPVDKVYGLLGLANDQDKYGPPDYSKSHTAVFAKVARIIIEDRGNLNLLRVAGIGDSLGGSTPGLPSWAPDWTTTRYNAANPRLSEWRARGDMHDLKEYRFLPALGILAAAGILVDVISATSSVLDDAGERRLLKPEALISDGKAVPYVNRETTRLQAYFQTLLCGCGLVTPKPLTVGSEEFHEAKAAFLYELGDGIDKVLDEQILGMKSTDYVVRFLRWMGESWRGRTDEQILQQFTGNEAQTTAREDSLDWGARCRGNYRMSRSVINAKCGGVHC